MAIRLQDYEGTKRLEEIREEEDFWNKWYEAYYAEDIEYDSHCIDLCLKRYVGDVVTLEHIPALKRIAEEESELSEEDRDYIRGLIKEVEKEYEKRREALDVAWEVEKEELDRIHARPHPAEDQPLELAQAHARITELEEELQQANARIQELEATKDEDQEEEDNPGAGRKGLHGLSCTQCVDAFALLLEEATGVPILIDGEYPQGQHPQKQAFTELYSLVTGKALKTCQAYTRQRKQANKQPLQGAKATKAETTIKDALRIYRGAK